MTLWRKWHNHPQGPWPPRLLSLGTAGDCVSGAEAHLGTVGLTVHGLDCSCEVPAAVPVLVRRVWPGSPAVARPRRSTFGSTHSTVQLVSQKLTLLKYIFYNCNTETESTSHTESCNSLKAHQKVSPFSKFFPISHSTIWFWLHQRRIQACEQCSST